MAHRGSGGDRVQPNTSPSSFTLFPTVGMGVCVHAMGNVKRTGGLGDFASVLSGPPRR